MHEKAEQDYRDKLNDPTAPEKARARAEKRYNELDRELDCVALTEHDQAEQTLTRIEAKALAGKQVSPVEEGRGKRAVATITRHEHLEDVRANGTPDERAELRQTEKEAVSRKNAERYLNSITFPGEMGTVLPDRNADVADTFGYIIYKQLRPGSKSPKDGTVLTDAEQQAYATALTEFDDGIEYRTKPAEPEPEETAQPEAAAVKPAPTAAEVLALLRAARTTEPETDTAVAEASPITAPTEQSQEGQPAATLPSPAEEHDPAAAVRHEAALQAWRKKEQKRQQELEAAWDAEDAKRAAADRAKLAQTQREQQIAEEVRKQAKRANPKRAKTRSVAAYKEARKRSQGTLYRATLNPFSKEYIAARNAEDQHIGRFSPEERKSARKAVARQRFLALIPGTDAHERALLQMDEQREMERKAQRAAERAQEQAAAASRVDARTKRKEKVASLFSFGRS
ncbi:hypothetical protein FQ330_03140 [Agrococcus sediminis]|uniref:Uncharacterized protein n=1 Tax=Agrococcus sediminis TaxID=2599924 RepID=A0A5M8QPE1_9MICO|nr:hypothetical protein [Agrococcus sediminis]KAA6436413.1 hypothetical protein FQ330_03140 [Agrococcus sediminis]